MRKLATFRDKRIYLLRNKFNKKLFPALKRMIKRTDPNHWYKNNNRTPWSEAITLYQKHQFDKGLFTYWSDGYMDNWSYEINLITEVLYVYKGTCDYHWTEVWKYNRYSKEFVYSRSIKPNR